MNSETELLRQAHPKFCKDGLVTSQAFYPFPKDEGLLSVDDGDKISPEESHKRFTETLGYQSESVWSVTAAEADVEQVPANADPLADNAEHCLLNFSAHNDKKCRKIAKKLKIFALDRGCRHPSV